MGLSLKEITDDYDLLIFDADGTLRKTTVMGQPCPNASAQWELMPGVSAWFASCPWGWGKKGFGIASNQAGVSFGYLTEQCAFGMLRDLATMLVPGIVAHVEMCVHEPGDGCSCRKPGPGMLERIMLACGAAPSRTLYVGDLQSDELCASRAKCQFAWAWEIFGESAWKDLTSGTWRKHPC